MSVAVQAVLRSVAAECGMTVADLLSPGNERRRVLPRKIAAWLCREVLGKRYLCLAEDLHQHHTTVIHAVRTLDAERAKDVELDALVRRLERNLRALIEGMPPELPAAPNPVWTPKGPKHAKYAPARETPRQIPKRRPAQRCSSLDVAAKPEIVRMYAAAFDATEMPAAGTACAWCRERRHFCPAKGFAGDLPLCRACGENAPCGFDVAFERMRNGYKQGEAA